MKKNLAYIISIIVIILILAAVLGYYLWRESTFQLADAEQQINEAMVDYSSIVSSTNSAGESVKKVTAVFTAGSGNQPVSVDELNSARSEVEIARKSLAAADQELDTYRSRVQTAGTFKVKDDYSTYIGMVGGVCDSLDAYINGLQSEIATLELILNAYSAGQIPQVQIDAKASSSDYHNAIMQRVNTDQALFTSENQMIGAGLLDASYQQANQYFQNCDAKLTSYANAVKNSQTDQLDGLYTDYQTSCGNDTYAANVQLRDAAWAAGIQKYISGLLVRLNDLQCEYAVKMQDAQTFHDANL
ncbi:MAG: hypothetical protein ACYC6O_09150 [Thermoleophilia bacterium]